MQQSVPDVLVKPDTTNPGKAPSVPSEEALESLLAVHAKAGWDLKLRRHSAQTPAVGQFTAIGCWHSVSEGLNCLDQKGTERHHGEAVALMLAARTFKLADWLEKALIVQGAKKSHQFSDILPPQGPADLADGPVGGKLDVG